MQEAAKFPVGIGFTLTLAPDLIVQDDNPLQVTVLKPVL